MYDFRERIKINSNYIDKDFILEFINHNKNYITKNNLSFFETSFAIALCYFKKINVPHALILDTATGKSKLYNKDEYKKQGYHFNFCKTRMFEYDIDVWYLYVVAFSVSKGNIEISRDRG